jgi:hypothetical protein
MVEGAWESEIAPTHGMTRRDRRVWRQSFDQLFVGAAGNPRGGVVEVDGGRLGWWRIRRRLRRYGVVASRVDVTTWELRRDGS